MVVVERTGGEGIERKGRIDNRCWLPGYRQGMCVKSILRKVLLVGLWEDERNGRWWPISVEISLVQRTRNRDAVSGRETLPSRMTCFDCSNPDVPKEANGNEMFVN